jgi:hypothetical protein
MEKTDTVDGNLLAEEAELTQPLMSEDNRPKDLESQHESTQSPQMLHKRTLSNYKVTVFLMMYFVMNITLTLYNKKVLGSVSPASQTVHGV